MMMITQVSSKWNGV